MQRMMRLLDIVQTQKSLEGHSDPSLLGLRCARDFRKSYFRDDTSLRFFTNSMIRPAT